MKKWIVWIAAALSTLTSPARADGILQAPAEEAQILPVEEASAPLEDAPPAPKQVGKASTDSATTAKRSAVSKYMLAAGAVAIGITALILVSRHHH